MSSIKKIAIVGAGLMGSGIASVCLTSGFEVILLDVFPESLQKAELTIQKNLAKSKEKGLISVEPRELLTKFKTSQEMSELKEADLIIEAVSENREVKEKVFAAFNEFAKAEAIIGSNTSALKISDLAQIYKAPERVLGIHFFNPATIMKLVELVKTQFTSEEVFATVKDCVLQMGKEAVTVKESFGFIVNRVLIPMINEAACIFEEGLASAEDIDKAMKLGANHPIGPLALADLIGIDVCLSIMQTLETGLNSPKYKAAKIFQTMISKKELGKKSGKGFYNYV